MVLPKVGQPCASYAVYWRLLAAVLLWACFTAHDGNMMVSSIHIANSRRSLGTGIGLRTYRNDGGKSGFTQRNQGSDFYSHSRTGAAKMAYVKSGPPLSIQTMKCGEIVLGVPTKRTEEGDIEVDIGTELPLRVAKESLVYLNKDERNRLNFILESKGKPEEVIETPVEELIKDTILVASEIPERKRMTHLKPKLMYANDFKKEKEGTHMLSYDVGVGGELKPRKLSMPCTTGKKQPHCWFRDDQMEFQITDLDTYSGLSRGEIWSPSIVESKRRIYTAMALEAVKPTCFITSYNAVIKQREGDLLTLQLLDDQLEGINAYALALPKDSVGDRVMVYLAASDPGVQQVYFTRRSIGNEHLRAENLKILYEEMIVNYVRTGKWFRAAFEEEDLDALRLRIVGKPDIEYTYTAHLYLSQMPYFSPEGALNEAFKYVNSPNDSFCYQDIMINVGKLNYGFHYDNCLFVRVHEYKTKPAIPGDRSGRAYRTFDQLELSTVNMRSPKGKMEEVFKKLTEQSVEDMKDLKIFSSYPSLIIGQDDGFMYLAINYRRKPEFSLKDDYFVGVMKIVPKSKNIPVGSIVNARICAISQNQVIMHYLMGHADAEGYDSFQYTSFTYWLSQRNKGNKPFGLSRFEQQKNLSIIWMDTLCIPPPGSPQYDKFLPLQPLITESSNVAGVDETFAPFVALEKQRNSEEGDQVAPEKVTKSLLMAAQKLERKGSSNVPIDMANFGSYTIQCEEGMDEAMAPPCYYVHNRDIRRSLIEEELNKSALWKFKRTLEMATIRTEGEIKGFFYDAKGRSLYDLLERLADPIDRRKIKPKEVLYFERSVKVLLSGLQDFYLESIYDNNDREKLIFASLVPRSSQNGDYVTMLELEKYINYIQYDFVMDRETRESFQRLLRCLAHPNNSLMSHMRNRHRNIPDDVFYFYRKTLHYDTWVDYSMPEPELEAADQELGMKGEEGVPSSVPMPPVSTLVKNPEGVMPHLLGQGLEQVKGLYYHLLRMQRTPTAQIMQRTLFSETQDMDERADDAIVPEDVDEVADDEYMIDESSKRKPAIPEIPRTNNRITSKEWRRLNSFPTIFDKEELKQYIRDIKMYKPVHGIKLPIL